MMKPAGIVLLLLSVAALCGVANAQDPPSPSDPQTRSVRYNVQEMNFDMWCQEEQHLPPDRCDKRLPEDDAAFSAYRAKVERYEIPYLQEQQKQIDINRDILHNDPVDHPDTPNQRSDTPSTNNTAPPPR